MSDPVEAIRARFKRADPAKWDQLESEQIMRDVSVLLYHIDLLRLAKKLKPQRKAGK